jgi:hypothetical protein
LGCSGLPNCAALQAVEVSWAPPPPLSVLPEDVLDVLDVLPAIGDVVLLLLPQAASSMAHTAGTAAAKRGKSTLMAPNHTLPGDFRGLAPSVAG